MSTRGLARKTLGAGSLWIFGVGASSPMTVLAGGIVATYATTGVTGVPLSFVLIAIALGFLAVGYVAVARHVPHAAPAYALLAVGLGRVAGVAGAIVAVVAYNAIQISLYGLVGVTVSGIVGGSWWLWAGLVWLLITHLGVARVTVNARLLAAALLAEIGVIALLDVAAFTHPAGGAVSFAPLAPDQLLVNGVGGVLALGVAAFIGFESAPIYAEEARTPSAVGRATFAALWFLAGFYAISAWALVAAVGPDHVVDEARTQGGGLPFTVLARAYDPILAKFAALLLVTSVIAAMLSFHHSIARHLYALGREKVLPARFAKLSGGARGGSPVGGSLVQSLTAMVVVTGFAVTGADPMGALFTWLSTLGAIGILGLLIGSSWAALRFFRTGGGAHEPVFIRVTAPVLGVLSGLVVLAVMVTNLDSLLGVPAGSPLTWVIPGLVVAAVAAGLLWGGWLRSARPQVYAGIGRGTPEPLAHVDQRLTLLDV